MRLYFSGTILRVSLAALAGTVAIHDRPSAQAAPPALESADPVLDRQLNMQQLEKDSKLMGMILAGVEPASKLSAAADALAKDAKDIRDSFQSKIPGGRTLPTVWENWGDFSKRLDDMVAKTDHLAQVAKGGNVAAVSELVADAIPCKGCHTDYRKPKT